MDAQLFEKAIVFTDLHLGHKHNSVEHNTDCMDFIDWMVDLAKQKGAETCICMGDFHHHRNTINISTLNYSLKVLRTLSKNFKNVYMLVGNHDNFYRTSREITSLEHGKEFSNIHIIDTISVMGDVALLPWLVDNEWKTIPTIKSKYIFGHLEIPGFKLNAMIEMPDHGQINMTHFRNQEYVFSGHFHKRQRNKNVIYIGNPFGHSFSDAGDTDRGCMFLEWDKEPEFINWEDGPRYVSVDLKSLLDNLDHYLKPKTYVKVTLNIDVSYEEALYLRETLMEQYQIRELKLIPVSASSTDHTEERGNIVFKSVDQMVMEGINSVESESFNTSTLIDIYNSL